ncbi:MAG: XRE family transcriptional regulator [Lachnospiraceae bacterium]|nr:XRE family transcriptional regulator [Lachnospiraceae bacterium]
MGKKSIKENKNIYQICREKCDFTRQRASEGMVFISDDRIEKIESGKSLPHPDEIIAMAECYKAPELCNYFCARECPIGQTHVTELKLQNLSQIILEMIASLNAMNKEKDRLIEITADGEITEDEIKDFNNIKNQLDRISVSIETLKLWVDKTIADGKLDDSISFR